MGGVEYQYDGGVFGALAFVDGAGVGEAELVEFGAFKRDAAAVEVYFQALFFFVGHEDEAGVAVEDVFFVVVLELHDPVAGFPVGAEQGESAQAVVEQLLQVDVEDLGSQGAAMHGGEYLHVAYGGVFQAAGNFVADDDVELGKRFGGVVIRNKVEVAAAVQVGAVPLVDAVGIFGDVAAVALPVDAGEAHAGDFGAGEQFAQYASGAYAGELVVVAHEQEPGAGTQSAYEGGADPGVHHAEFVHHDAVGFERVFVVAFEDPAGGVDFEQAVQGAGFALAEFAHAAGGAAGGGGEQYGFFAGGAQVQYALERGGFAGAGAAGDDV